MELVKYNNNSISSVTALASIASGDLNLIATNTITSGVSSSSFTSNIDSTYDTYIFKFISMHPASDSVSFTFNGSTDGGSNYNVTKTTSYYLNISQKNKISFLLQKLILIFFLLDVSIKSFSIAK